VKLYLSAASSFARKVRVVLLEKRVAHEVETINLWEPNDLGSVNPLGKVPALRLDDGRVLVSSPLICDYVDARYPEPRFIPQELDARTEVRRWEALADGCMEAVSATLYEMRFHDEAKRSADWLARQKKKFEAGFATLEQMLGERRWCVGDAMSLADIAIACHLGFINLRQPKYFPRERYPRLTALWARLEERDSFRKSAPPAAT
jgi:glutathione S-transferase